MLSPRPARRPARRRALPALLTFTVGATFALAGCASGGSGDGDAASPAGACTDAGSASDSIEVMGAFGEVPEVVFDAPLGADKTERTVFIEGDGDVVAEDGMQVLASYSLFSGDTGEEIGSTGFGEGAPTEAFLIAADGIEGLVRTVNCSVVGDRIAAVIPTAELGLGDEMGETVVMVLDVVEVSEPANALTDLVEVPAGTDGLPAVTLADDAAPEVVIPESPAPDDLTVVVFEEGSGDAVADGDTVELNYTGINWTTGETFDSSWSRGATAEFATDQVIPGFGAALVGRTPGTRMMVVIPPLYGYGSGGNAGAGISGTDTILFVIDVVGTTPAG